LAYLAYRRFQRALALPAPVSLRRLPLLAVGLVLALPASRSLAGAGIENPTCELVAPGVYRIDFQASPGATPVEVFASSKPDRIDSAKVVVTIRQGPAEVSIPDHPGRIYFHLKPTVGATRVVSIRRLPWKVQKTFGTWVATEPGKGVTSAGAWCTARIISLT